MPAPRARERRPSRHRSLAAPLAVQHERATARCGDTEVARRAADAAAATRHPRAQVSTRGCRPTERRRFAARRTAKAAAADRDRKRRRRRAAAGAFLYRLDSKTGGMESRARSLTLLRVSTFVALSLTHPTLLWTGERRKEALTKPKKVMTRTKSR